MDVRGAALFAISIVSLFLLLTFLQYETSIWMLITVISVSLIGFVMFIQHERKTDQPMVDPALFQNKGLVQGFGSLLAFSALGGTAYFLPPFFLKIFAKMTPDQIGLIVLGLPLAMGIAGPLGGILVDKFRVNSGLVGGLTVIAGVASFLFLNPDTPRQAYSTERGCTGYSCCITGRP